MKQDQDCCRVAWHPRILAFFITIALGLSAISSLDCKFLAVDLGFTPEKYYSELVGIGLWSYEKPDGRCLSYGASHTSSGFSDGLYSNSFINEDLNWSVARILAMCGVVFGFFAFLLIWTNVFKSEPVLVDFVLYLTATTFMCESAKMGLFLGNDICKSPDYWFNIETEEYSGSKYCGIDRGLFMSICSMFAYFAVMAMACWFAARPSNTGDYAYDESSLASFTGSDCENDPAAKLQSTTQQATTHQEQAQIAAQSGAQNSPVEYYALSPRSSQRSHMSGSIRGSIRGSIIEGSIQEGSGRGSMREDFGEGLHASGVRVDQSLKGEEGHRSSRSYVSSDHMQPYPPSDLRKSRKYEGDLSTLTFDPGY